MQASNLLVRVNGLWHDSGCLGLTVFVDAIDNVAATRVGERCDVGQEFMLRCVVPIRGQVSLEVEMRAFTNGTGYQSIEVRLRHFKQICGESHAILCG